jgi:hypothetical protein
VYGQRFLRIPPHHLRTGLLQTNSINKKNKTRERENPHIPMSTNSAQAASY